MAKDDDIFAGLPPADNKEMRIEIPPEGKGGTDDKKTRKTREKTDTKPTPSKVSKLTLKSNFKRVFNFLSKLFKSTKEFSDDEFEELASDVVSLSSKFEFVLSFVDLLTPLFLVLDIIDKVLEIKKHKPPKENGDEMRG